jgi:hypothetical protein
MTLTIYFCENCGTKIYKEGSADAFKGIAIVQASTLDGRIGEKVEGMGIEDVKIGGELYVKDRVGWLQGRDGTGQMREFV